MSQNRKPPRPPVPKLIPLHYICVLAEIGYNEVVAVADQPDVYTFQPATAKIQFFSNSDSANIPLARLNWLQNHAAAMAVQGGIKAENITGCFINNIIPLGWMTPEEFVAAGESTLTEAATNKPKPPVAPAATAPADDVEPSNINPLDDNVSRIY